MFRNTPLATADSAPVYTELLSDSALIARVAEGDQQAYAALVDRHLDKIIAFVQRASGSRADAEDIAQEVFLRVWKTADQWQDRGIAYATWLHRVALNICHDRWRRQSPVTEVLDESLLCQAPTPEEHAMQDAQARQVREALNKLPERQRIAVILSHYQGFTNIEASKIMDISVEAMESLLGRGRRKLKSLLLHELLTMDA